jgi:hypothetical protein
MCEWIVKDSKDVIITNQSKGSDGYDN